MVSQSAGERSGRKKKSRFTTIEVVALVVLIIVFAIILAPQLVSVLDSAKVRRAVDDIDAIQLDIAKFEAAHGALPATLEAIGRGAMRDPWGHPYVYLPFDPVSVRQGGPPAGARTDKLYRPLNSTFDLYSVGKDGLTNPSVSAAVSLDDIVRVRDGEVKLARAL